MSTYVLCNSDTELYHHGILGQKWGVRRFQNADGTLTDQGKRRYEKFDSKSYKESLHKEASSRGMSNIHSTALINNAAALAANRDKQTWKQLQRQNKIEAKMEEAHAVGNTRAMEHLGKKWIASQSSIRANEMMSNSDQLELGEAYLKYRMGNMGGAMVGGVVGGAVAAGLQATDKKSYINRLVDAGVEGKKQAVSDYEKFKKQRRWN